MVRKGLETHRACIVTDLYSVRKGQSQARNPSQSQPLGLIASLFLGQVVNTTSWSGCQMGRVYACGHTLTRPGKKGRLTLGTGDKNQRS